MRSPQIAAAALALPLVLLGCDPDQPPFGPRVVDVATAEKRLVPELRDYPARLEAPARVDVVARTNGYLLERTFEEGTEVEQNRILFSLQSDHYENALAAAQAELEQARVALARRENASQKKAPAPDDSDKAISLQTARTEVALREAAVENAALELAYTTLRAPIGGRIDSHPIDVGNLVRPGDRLATIVQLDPIGLVFEAPAGDIPRLREAHRETPLIAQIVGPDGRVHERPGRVQAFGGVIEGPDGTVQVRALVPNARSDLLAGQNTTARLLLRWHVDAVVVAQRAIHKEDGETFALVINAQDRVERRVVRTGPVHAGQQVVHQGLKAGERVVVGRKRAAVPGRRVRPLNKELGYPEAPALAAHLTPPAASPAPEATPVPPPTPGTTPTEAPDANPTAAIAATIEQPVSSTPPTESTSGKDRP